MYLILKKMSESSETHFLHLLPECGEHFVALGEGGLKLLELVHVESELLLQLAFLLLHQLTFMSGLGRVFQELNRETRQQKTHYITGQLQNNT